VKKAGARTCNCPCALPRHLVPSYYHVKPSESGINPNSKQQRATTAAPHHQCGGRLKEEKAISSLGRVFLCFICSQNYEEEKEKEHKRKKWKQS